MDFARVGALDEAAILGGVGCDFHDNKGSPLAAGAKQE
ncbi:hypothetical protein BACT_0396 [Bifidobacterium actinocoloniiforme DSM 22766]|uniref:Uncharacterized protein n=1 Tax=Bifidobacterium actinocoloniiforme DSM 22766 TaxID=1437605 RepID=A0A086YZJ6_9BIFI|nr:hypothetical protein BACT_0396 [Bifidobacterium actinocoloniiforme DSM 22766]